MKKKGNAVVLVLIIIAGIGLYCAWYNRDISKLPAATTGSTLAELWTSAGGQQPRAQQPARASQATRTARSTAAPRSTASASTSPKSSYIYAKEYQMYPGVAEIPENKYLICVNHSRALPAKYRVSLAVCVENIYPENRMMEKEAAAQYRKMYDAALAVERADNEKIELIPFSSYRSTAQQKISFDREVKALEDAGIGRKEAIERVLKTIQLPGCSEHETGLAVDITRKGVWKADPGFAESKEFEWMQKNAHNYGFILRYPKNKEAITGVSYEPWHWRYVGMDAAAAMKKSGQCLEEYMKIKS